MRHGRVGKGGEQMRGGEEGRGVEVGRREVGKGKVAGWGRDIECISQGLPAHTHTHTLRVT